MCALVKQACPHLTPAAVKNILKSTARDVTTGTCNPATGGNAAGPGPDLATGSGLVDANRAVLVAKIRCLGPIRPILPIRPIQPVRPIEPIQPITVKPILPVQPITPVAPITPVRPPIGVVGPIRPQPIQPIEPPIGPGPRPAETEAQAEAAGGPLSAEEVAALEEMVRESDDADLEL